MTQRAATNREAPSWLLPRPLRVVAQGADYLLAPQGYRAAGPDEVAVRDVTRQWDDMIRRRHGMAMVADVASSARYELTLGDPTAGPEPVVELGPEGYRLTANETGVHATAATPAGLRWAAMTLFQLCCRRGGLPRGGQTSLPVARRHGRCGLRSPRLLEKKEIRPNLDPISAE